MKFKVGDKVKITGKHSRNAHYHFGKEATIIQIARPSEINDVYYCYLDILSYGGAVFDIDLSFIKKYNKPTWF